MLDADASILRPQRPRPRSLSTLVSEFGLTSIGSLDGIELTGITMSTHNVQSGDLFVGLPGARVHGASFAAQARADGAVALLTDPAGASIAVASGLPIVITDSPREMLGQLSAWAYLTGETYRTGETAPILLGITGTNGKTSVSYLLSGILRQLGVVTGLSSTAERRIGELAATSNLTTPEATEVHGLLARMHEESVGVAILEVSAQALTRSRVDGLTFDVVAFLNLSHDHLDDYSDMEQYFEAKRELFDPARARRGVISLDTPWGERLREWCAIPVTTISSGEGAYADWVVRLIEERAEFTEFSLSGPSGQSLRTRVPVIGRHMAANAGVAIVMLIEAGFSLDQIQGVLDRDSGIVAYLPGRMERISSGAGPALYVDYGHSPDAFTSTISAIRKFTTGRLIMIFGADGDRDSSKRIDMGRIASEEADVLVITDYNPRFEDAAQIRATLIKGARAADHPAEIHEVPDQARGIRAAISFARQGDSVLWAGPGHEDYIDVQGQHLPFSARSESRDALREAGWA